MPFWRRSTMKFKDDLVKFMKFNAVGILNTGVDFVVYTLLTALGMSLVPAQVISYGCGMLNSYLFNSRWTFKDRVFTVGKGMRFVAVNLVSLGVSIGILTLCKNWWGIEGALAKLISVPFSLTVNFIGSRLFVFKDRGDGGAQTK